MLDGKVQWHIKLSLVIVLCLLFLQPEAALGLIEVGHGSDPVQDRGWPLGAVAMANLPTRVGWWVGPPLGGGEWHFVYRWRTTEEFNQALEIFASIRAPRLELVIHDGPRCGLMAEDCEKESKAEERTDSTFTVWNPERWHRLYNRIDSFRASRQPASRQPVPAPRLDVYVGGGAIVWDRVEVPGQLVVIDKREESAAIKPVGGGLVRGDIFDMCTGKPIPGAHIALVGLEGQEDRASVIHGRADDWGAFQIEKIPAGRYEITVRADGYASRRVGAYRNKGSTYHTLVTHLARESSIKGVVTDVEGNGISGVEVYATDIFGIDGQDYPSVDAHPAITDAQGRFEVRSLPVGFVQLRCRAASMHLATSTCEICEVPGERLKLTMEGTGRIRGKVVDKYGDVPPGELHVHVRPVGELLIGTWGGSARCEEDGSFDFAEVPPGRYLVGTNFMLLHEDRDPNAKPVSIEPGTTVELEIVHDVPVKPH